MIVGDGEFDGVGLQQDCEEYGWSYVVRAAKNINCYEEGCEEPFKPQDLSQQGEVVSVPEVCYTEAKYGPVLIIAQWDSAYDKPIYLVTNLELAAEATALYKRRCLIETFFSDQKTRGFNLQKTRITDPKRLSRLLLVACFAYIWMVYLGAQAKEEGRESQFGRTDRKVLSLFQLGLRYLEHLLECAIPLPSGFFTPLDFWEESLWL